MSKASFFFYDLETSGIQPSASRIMQFAGQRTDMDLNPIGNPYNFLIKLPEDVIPDPGAIIITGITPQQTLSEGVSEAEFFKIFCQEIIKPNTTFVGFNNIRFDDEFIRYGLFRNFYDPYEWQWKDGVSKWDILDLSRLCRALRPEGIKWPFASDGKPTNRLEYLAEVNKLVHDNAHDALSDVNATIAVAKLIKSKQPKLFTHQFDLRSKKEVADFLSKNDMFVYVSGKYPSENEKLGVVKVLGPHPTKNDAVLVLNLAVDCQPFLSLDPAQLVKSWTYNKETKDEPKLPVKTLKFNRCPAIAQIGTLGEDEKKRLKISDDLIRQNLSSLQQNPEFYQNVCRAIEAMDQARQTEIVVDSKAVDTTLYDNFISDTDKKLFSSLHQTAPKQLSGFADQFRDERLKKLLPLFKARNFPAELTTEERQAWESHKSGVYLKQLPKFMSEFEKTANLPQLSSAQKYALEELKLYVESLIPPELYS